AGLLRQLHQQLRPGQGRVRHRLPDPRLRAHPQGDRGAGPEADRAAEAAARQRRAHLRPRRSEVMQSIAEGVESVARNKPDHPAIIEGETVTTYGEFSANMLAIASS